MHCRIVDVCKDCLIESVHTVILVPTRLGRLVIVSDISDDLIFI